MSRIWLNPGGARLDGPPRLTRIPIDLGRGASIRLPFAVRAPRTPGHYRLRVTLVQAGGAWFDEPGGPVAEASVEVARGES